MSKVQGSYSSIIKGVSQQAPADRLEGQHGEVVNMLSDPVRGLVRRNGMILDSKRVAPVSAAPANALEDSFSFRTFPYVDNEQKFDVLYRSRDRVGSVTDAHLNTLEVYNKTTKAWYPVVRPSSDAILDLYESGGISAITSIGSYVLFAANSVAPSYNTEEGLNNLGWKNSAVIWVRGGGYARTYTVTATRASDGAQVAVSYTTPQSTYPGTLDLVGAVPPGAIGSPFEQYFINAAQAAYDTQVNQWISSSSAAIVPSAIATQLASKLNATGFGGWVVIGSNLVNDNVSFINVTDGGNGDFIRAVVQDVAEAGDLTDIHRVGKVVRVKPTRNTTEVYYLKAEPKVEGNGSPYQEVIWREAAGMIQHPAHILALGRVVGSQFFWASSAAALDALILANTGQTLPSPALVSSTAGDLLTVPPNAFYGRRVTMLTVFQDRLGIGSGGTLSWSETGDYFNFYKTTTLSLIESDAFEVSATGADGDTIRKAILYDKNLTVYGDQNQYVINGRVPISPSNKSMAVQFSMTNAADAQPVGTGKHVFLLKEDDQLAASRLMQIQTGDFQDTPSLIDVSQQLRDYVNGTPAEMVALTKPDAIFVRTEHYLKSQGGFPRARPWGLYLYQYLDGPDGRTRLTDAWSAWEWSTALGTPIGISDAGKGDAILLYTIAFGTDQNGAQARGVFVLKASVRGDPTGLPYMDGLEPAATAQASGLWTAAAVQGVKDAVITASGAAYSFSAVPATTDADRFVGLEHPHYTVGDGPAELLDPHRWHGVYGWLSQLQALYPTIQANNAWTGLYFPSFVDVTNPFVRDRDGKANTLGTMTLTKLSVTTTRSAGFVGSWRDYSGAKTVLNQGGNYKRIDYGRTVWVGRDTKHVQVRLAAKDWYPLTISTVEWQGNWFAYKGRA